MKLELDKAQAASLIKLVLLGQILTDTYNNEPNPEFDKIVRTVLNEAHRSQMHDLVLEDSDGQLYPSEGLEILLESFFEEYEENSFWETLIEELINRDLTDTHGEDYYEKLSANELEIEQAKIAEVYLKEFETNGLKKLKIHP